MAWSEVRYNLTGVPIRPLGLSRHWLEGLIS